MSSTSSIALRIYGGSVSAGFGRAPLVSFGKAPEGYLPTPPTLVDEPQAWMIVHAQDYTLYALYSRAYKTAAQEPGQLLVCAFLPPSLRISEGKSPSSLLSSLRDHFTVMAAPGMVLPVQEQDSSSYRTMAGLYPLDERPMPLPIMSGPEPASFCVQTQGQLEALMLYSRYEQLAKVGRLELGFHCPSTVSLPLGGAQRPASPVPEKKVRPAVVPPPVVEKKEAELAPPVAANTQLPATPPLVTAQPATQPSAPAASNPPQHQGTLDPKYRVAIILTACALAVTLVALFIGISLSSGKKASSISSEESVIPSEAKESIEEVALPIEAVPVEEAVAVEEEAARLKAEEEAMKAAEEAKRAAEEKERKLQEAAEATKQARQRAIDWWNDHRLVDWFEFQESKEYKALSHSDQIALDKVFRYRQYSDNKGYTKGTSFEVKEIVEARLPLRDWNDLLNLKKYVEQFTASRKMKDQKETIRENNRKDK